MDPKVCLGSASGFTRLKTVSLYKILSRWKRCHGRGLPMPLSTPGSSARGNCTEARLRTKTPAFDLICFDRHYWFGGDEIGGGFTCSVGIVVVL